MPAYRDLYDRAGAEPLLVRGVADLERLPSVTKADLRLYPTDQLVADDLDRESLPFVQTTGSTGRPFRIYNTWIEYRIRHLFRLRAHRQFGRRLADTGSPP